jgi:hypothetical protein
MASAIFNAIGRGYSARTILSAIGRRSPQYANNINAAYYSGYTAQQILSRMTSSKDKHYDPELFMTDHERTMKNHERNKKNALMTAVGAAGTAGAAMAGLYAYLNRNSAIYPDAIHIPRKGQLSGKSKGKNGHTIHQDRLQIENKQKQIGYDQKQIAHQGKGKPRNLPYQPLVPHGPENNDVDAHQQPQEPPPQFKNVPPRIFERSYNAENHPAPVPQPENLGKPYIKSVNVLQGLGEADRIMSLIEGGATNDEMKLILPMVMKKQDYNIISKGNEIDKLLNDMQEYVKENPREKLDLSKSGNFNEYMQNKEQPPPQQENASSPQMPPPQPQVQPAQQMMQHQHEPQPIQSEQIPPALSGQLNQTANEMVRKPENIQPQAPSRMVKTNSGESGDLIDVKNGVATVNVDGKDKKFKFSDLETSPQNVEDAFRFVMNSVPEEKKSTALMGTIHMPHIDLMVTTFYNGDMVWYSQASEQDYNDIVFSKNAPKGQARTGIAEYNPNTADSRGNAFWKFKNRPIYSKENEGKTWGYIKNRYSLFDHIQPIIHKISKERYDAEGNLITSKPRAKKEPAKPKVEKPVSSPKPKEKPASPVKPIVEEKKQESAPPPKPKVEKGKSQVEEPKLTAGEKKTKKIDTLRNTLEDYRYKAIEKPDEYLPKMNEIKTQLYEMDPEFYPSFYEEKADEIRKNLKVWEEYVKHNAHTNTGKELKRKIFSGYIRLQRILETIKEERENEERS